jgi:hypothetical protein
MVTFTWRTGAVDYQEAKRTMPPIVTTEGIPPLPGEGWGPYTERVERILMGARQ